VETDRVKGHHQKACQAHPGIGFSARKPGLFNKFEILDHDGEQGFLLRKGASQLIILPIPVYLCIYHHGSQHWAKGPNLMIFQLVPSPMTPPYVSQLKIRALALFLRSSISAARDRGVVITLQILLNRIVNDLG